MFAGLTSRWTMPALWAKRQAGADLFEVGNLVGQRQISPLLDDVRERFALDVLHRDVRPVVLLAAGVDRDDVGVAQRGRRARLAEEAVHDFLVVDFLANDLDRDLAIQFRVAAQIHRTHAASADLPDDFEGADL